MSTPPTGSAHTRTTTVYIGVTAKSRRELVTNSQLDAFRANRLCRGDPRAWGWVWGNTATICRYSRPPVTWARSGAKYSVQEPRGSGRPVVSASGLSSSRAVCGQRSTASGLLEGRCVGCADGFTDGWDLGDDVGLAEGRLDSCTEGTEAGCIDGCAEGCADSCPVGSIIGWLDGCIEGCVEGFADGCTDGFDDGFSVGCRVGCLDGCILV
ncbi:hypothetical protein B484DRAFT_324932 [Ochromonadaceae sp. CCMP2298]|nr:hypothetical protein B484DRAFT_324932 [Ochromonadaceae sp. CCMP2298]|mmetsp:Transcript_24070/g.54032  ORF Transcript_24070/g.54032 Transcript_24070/m.54032 type:complete len:211 (-) Transcript_24070:595-1227(-)